MRVSVIGAGSWGTALAKLAADAGHDVTMWAYEAEVVEQLREGVNRVYMPDVRLPTLRATGALDEALAGAEIIISVMPSHVVRTVWQRAAPHLGSDPIVLSATKGIEESTLCSMSTVLRDVLPERHHRRLAVLSGPSFAAEVARQQPTAVVVASSSADVAQTVQAALRTNYFRVYTSSDMTGVEIGGAAKNVVAIAVGMSDGLGYGANARAALITRGLAEITRIAVAQGGNPLTLAGLSGLGDLVLTCTGDLSRNRRVGLRLGGGESLQQIQAETQMVAEGVFNAKSCRGLAARLGVEMPVAEMVHAVLYDGLNPRTGARRLMQRTQKGELDGVVSSKPT
jgi:glycerol-3-phosphate dehydrogenase (NAD(P)+)